MPERLPNLQCPNVLPASYRCGPANHSVQLAKKGHKVFALDDFPSLLAYAKEKAEAEGVDVGFLKQDMLEFTLPVKPCPQ